MRLDTTDPDHVRLHEVRTARWVLLLLAMGAAIAVGACWAPLALPNPIAVVAVLALSVALAALVTLRFHTTIAISREVVRYQRRQLFGSVVREGPRAALRHVTLRGKIVVTSTGENTLEFMQYDVALVSEHETLPLSIPVHSGAKEQATRRFAEAVCRALQLPLHDLLGENPDVRNVVEFGRRPTFRKPTPDGAPPRGIVASTAAYGQLLASTRALPRSRVLLSTLAVFAALLGAVVVGAFLAPGSGAGGTMLWLFPALVTASLLVLFTWLCFGRVELFVADDELHHVQRLFGLAIRHRRVPIATIAQVRTQTRTGASTHLHAGVAIVTDQATLLVGSGLSVEAMRWLSAWLEAQLWPQLPVELGG